MHKPCIRYAQTPETLSIMNFLDQLERLKRINQLIKMKATGTPQQLARRLDLSERRVYQLIKLMKELEAPVHFDRERNSYCYEYDFSLSLNFE